MPHYFPLSKIKNKFLTIESFRKQHQASNRSTHYIRSSRSQMFFKIRVFKNFAILTGTHLCRSLFLIKLQAWRPETLLKRDSKAWNFVEKKLRHSFSCEICKIFQNTFFTEHFRWLLLTMSMKENLNKPPLFLIFIYIFWSLKCNIPFCHKVEATNAILSVTKNKWRRNFSDFIDLQGKNRFGRSCLILLKLLALYLTIHGFTISFPFCKLHVFYWKTQ